MGWRCRPSASATSALRKRCRMNGRSRRRSFGRTARPFSSISRKVCRKVGWWICGSARMSSARLSSPASWGRCYPDIESGSPAAGASRRKQEPVGNSVPRCIRWIRARTKDELRPRRLRAHVAIGASAVWQSLAPGLLEAEVLFSAARSSGSHRKSPTGRAQSPLRCAPRRAARSGAAAPVPHSPAEIPCRRCGR